MEHEGIKEITDPVKAGDGTSDMFEFPSKTYPLYPYKEDKKNDTYWNNDYCSKTYINWRHTKGKYSCDKTGKVTQESTGW